MSGLVLPDGSRPPIPAHAERETLVEMLQAGDRFRWLGKTYTVRAIRQGWGKAGASVVVETDEVERTVRHLDPVTLEFNEAPKYRTFIGRPGFWLAAECPR